MYTMSEFHPNVISALAMPWCPLANSKTTILNMVWMKQLISLCSLHAAMPGIIVLWLYYGTHTPVRAVIENANWL